MSEYHLPPSEPVEQPAETDGLPPKHRTIAEQIIALETWLIDHADSPRIAQALRSADRVAVEHRLTELRDQQRPDEPGEAA